MNLKSKLFALTLLCAGMLSAAVVSNQNLDVVGSPKAGGSVKLRLRATADGAGEIKIFNAAGQPARHFSTGNLDTKVSFIDWDQLDNYGGTVPAGTYTIYFTDAAGAEFQTTVVLN